MEYQLTGLKAPDEEHLERCAEFFRQNGLICTY
jgi:hypothetical protein